ncbi:MAG TPA: hypothetical protein VMR70_12000 [Flavisolibacter sp.]|nr:hypothetical protein [Flavisolibacter sp.]
MIKEKIFSFCLSVVALLLVACNAAGDASSGNDSTDLPSALDTMKTPIHPGMVDSTGTPRLQE